MKAKLLEIYWHEKQPIYALSSDNKSRFVSAGADNSIRIWTFSSTLQIVHLSSLQKHSKAVNTIAFHPKDDILASAGDGALLIIWKLQDQESISESKYTPSSELIEQNITENQEIWNPVVISRIADTEDIYDLKWTPCGSTIILALTNNTTVLWNYETGKIIKTIRDHSHFVQGISVDPLGKLIASQSSDRSVKIYFTHSSKPVILKCIQTLSRCPAQLSSKSCEKINYKKLFHDETLLTFFRRLSFSPDGSLLAVPCGLYNDSFTTPTPLPLPVHDQSCVYLYTRASLLSLAQALPSIVLGPFEKSPVVVCFHPKTFQLKTESSILSLPYAMILAIATQDSVFIYRTDILSPLVVLKGMHLATLTDLCWTTLFEDNSIVLLISSTDGFCSAVIFENNELGILN